MLASTRGDRAGPGVERPHRFHLGIDLSATAEFAQVLVKHVMRDSKQVRAKARAFADSITALVEPHEGLVDEVLGRVAGLVTKKTDDRIAMTVVKPKPSFVFTPAPAIEQRRVDLRVVRHRRKVAEPKLVMGRFSTETRLVRPEQPPCPVLTHPDDEDGR